MIPWLENILFSILPGYCILCGAPSARHLDLCMPCEKDLPWLGDTCRYCAIPLSNGNSVCGECMMNPPALKHCHCAFSYEYPVDRMIIDFKANRKIITGRLLATLLLKSFPGEYTPPDLLVPVPLHKSTLKERGFNQSLEIAEVLSDHWSVPLDSTNCRRIRKTADQKSLHRSAREKNIRGAFALDAHYHGERIAIIDDVVTTGATLREFARLVLESGAGSTEAICIARTPNTNRGPEHCGKVCAN